MMKTAFLSKLDYTENQTKFFQSTFKKNTFRTLVVQFDVEFRLEEKEKGANFNPKLNVNVYFLTSN